MRWLGLGCWTAGVLADDVKLLDLATRLEGAARPHGALASLSVGLLHLAMVRLAQGLLPTARDHLSERTALQDAMGGRPTSESSCPARGTVTSTDPRRDGRVSALASSHHHGWMLTFSDYAGAVLDLGLGHYGAALEPARRTYWDNPSLVLAAFPNLIEAAWRSDAGELAKEAASDLRDRTGERPSPLVCALLETAAALGSRPSRAEVHFEAALQRLPWRDGVVGGRIALLYGEWLRRQKRKLDAREQLRNAHATLAAAGRRPSPIERAASWPPPASAPLGRSSGARPR